MVLLKSNKLKNRNELSPSSQIMKLSKGLKKRKYYIYNIQTIASAFWTIEGFHENLKVFYYFRSVSENLVEFSRK